MATITAASYSHSIYHTITKPSLHAAMVTFASSNAMHSINTVVRDCFIKHNVQREFTACINHRHFDLAADERNIEEADGRAIASTRFEGTVPCSWLFHDRNLYPYEFRRLDEGETANSEPPAAFVNELGAILDENGLCDIIGLQAYKEGIVGMEKTDREKRVSTTKSYPEGAKEVDSPRNAVIASFAFF